MAESLGEKLRNAREARGISIREIADQTRISARYLEAIEENNYKPLPGGVFNKGFIKSYAKYVGVDEKEALEDYNKLVVTQGFREEENEVSYRKPEIHTGDVGGSQWLTILGAIVILGLLTAGIIYGLQWYQSQQSQVATTPPKGNTATASNTNAAISNTANANTATPTVLEDGEYLAVFKALNEKAEITSFADGKYESRQFEPQQSHEYKFENSLKIKYYRLQSNNLELTINGKKVTLPPPTSTKRNGLEFTLTKENLPQILAGGQVLINGVLPTALAANANVANTNR